MAEQLPKLSTEFREFLTDAHKLGYGAPEANVTRTESGARIISYQKDGWRYHDQYAGGVPFVGFEQVSVIDPRDRNRWMPVWGMNYFGRIEDDNFTGRQLGDWLRLVLRDPDIRIPVRGPTLARRYGEEYQFRSDGELEAFSATERILLDDRVVYTAQMIGGLINRKAIVEAEPQQWLEQERK